MKLPWIGKWDDAEDAVQLEKSNTESSNKWRLQSTKDGKVSLQWKLSFVYLKIVPQMTNKWQVLFTL